MRQENGCFKASCPVPDHGKGRGDLEPSLSVGLGDDGRVLLNCHVGCSKAEIVSAVGLSISDLFEKPARNVHKANGHWKKPVETYSYTDETGNLLFQSLRYKPKGFSQRKPDGAGGWVYKGVFGNGTRPVLYRLPKVLAAVREGRPVWVAEGEKDVHRLERIGLAATTSPMGAEKWRDHLSEALAGADVRILPDNDEPGRRHARKVAKSLHGKAASVKIIELPGVPEDGGDFSDWMDAGGTAEELEKLAAQAPEWEPPEPEPASKSGHRQKPNLTDVGNAERLVERHGEDIRYCYPLSQWLCFGGQRWRGDDAGEVERRSKETVRATLREAAPEEGPIIDRDLARHALASESRARIEAMIALARSEPGIPIRPEEMDLDQWLLNAENGTIDLRTGELREHRREDLITKLAPVEYDPSAEAPTWEVCLKTWLPSEGLRRFVQKAVGYALTGDVSEQVLLFLYGTGANGKSTLINALMEAMGDYALQAAPELLTVKASAHPTELADLKGARFVASVEVEDGKHLAESLVKQMTGGDRIKARFMRADFFEFSPTHKVFLAANHKPEVRGTDTGIWRRIKTVPFDVTIPKGERDPALLAKLRDELPGILRWAVEGCLLWQRRPRRARGGQGGHGRVQGRDGRARRLHRGALRDQAGGVGQVRRPVHRVREVVPRVGRARREEAHLRHPPQGARLLAGKGHRQRVDSERHRPALGARTTRWPAR